MATFAPLIMLPANIGGDIDPKWSTCAQYNYGIPDPPKALVPAGAVNPAATLGASVGRYLAPSPGSTPQRQEAPNTAVAASPTTSSPALKTVAQMSKQSAGPAPNKQDLGRSTEGNDRPASSPSAQQAANTQAGGAQPTDAPVATNPLSATLPVDSLQLSPFQGPPEPVSLLLLGGEKLTPIAGSSTLLIIHGQTLTLGGAATVVAGATISYDKGSIYVNGDGASIPTTVAALAASLSWGDTYSVATANAKEFSSALFAPNPATNSFFVATDGGSLKLPGKVLGASFVDVAGSIITPGAPAVIVNNARVSVDPKMSQIAVNGVPQALPQPSIPATSTDPIAAAFSVLFPKPALQGVDARLMFGASNINARPLADQMLSIPVSVNTVAGHAITAAPSGGVAYNGATLKPGGPPMTIQGTIFSLDATGSLVIDGKSYLLSPQATAGFDMQPIATVAGQVIFTGPKGAVLLNGQILNPGDPAVIISGTHVSLGAAGLVVGTTTVPLPASPSQIAGFEVTTDGAGNVFISGKMLHPGDPAIWISGTRVSLGNNGLILGSSTMPLLAMASRAGNIEFTTDAIGNVIIGGTTLHRGDPAVTISGSQVSLGENGLVIGTRTMSQATATQAGDVQFTTDAVGNVIIGGTTLHRGDPAITVSGSRISLGDDGLVIGTRTMSQAIATQIGDIQFTIDAVGNVIIGGTKLQRGDPAITVSGSRISLGDDDLVIGTQTIPISSPPTQTAGLQFVTDGAGNIIINGVTLHPNDAALIISGTRISLGNNGLLTFGTRTLQVSSLPTAIAGQELATDGNGNLILNNGLIIHPNDVLTISGTRLFLGLNGILTAGTLTIPLSSLPTTIAGQQLATDGNGNLILNNALIIHPNDVLTISNTRLSLGLNGILTAGTLTIPLSSLPTSIAGLPLTINTNGSVLIGGKLLHPGDAGITISGTSISLGPNGLLTAGTKTIPITTTPKIFTIGGLVFTSLSGGVIVSDGTTLLNGSPARTIDGKLVSVDTNGVISVEGGKLDDGDSFITTTTTTNGVSAIKETSSAAGLRSIDANGGAGTVTGTHTKKGDAARGGGRLSLWEMLGLSVLGAWFSMVGFM
ncbi:MAG: hypothetical protein M1812_000868 [Candelaria pacifica]|nr:MAG: hypothetical protein M1812_000868 [Candelaria pacifica]